MQADRDTRTRAQRHIMDRQTCNPGKTSTLVCNKEKQSGPTHVLEIHPEILANKHIYIILMTENSSFFSEAPRTFHDISKLHPLFILLNLNAHTPTVWLLLFEQSQPNSLITEGQKLFQRLLIHFLLSAMFSPQCSVSFLKPGRCLQKSEALAGDPHPGLGMMIAHHSLTGAHRGLQNTFLNSLSWQFFKVPQL